MIKGGTLGAIYHHFIEKLLMPRKYWEDVGWLPACATVMQTHKAIFGHFLAPQLHHFLKSHCVMSFYVIISLFSEKLYIIIYDCNTDIVRMKCMFIFWVTPGWSLPEMFFFYQIYFQGRARHKKRSTQGVLSSHITGIVGFISIFKQDRK